MHLKIPTKARWTTLMPSSKASKAQTFPLIFQAADAESFNLSRKREKPTKSN